jgi:protein-S-isoprenylcysteine O-methyltransferase Ste14
VKNVVGVYIHIASILLLYIAAVIGRNLINENSTKEHISRVSQFVLGVLNLVIFGGYFFVFFYPGIDVVDRATGLGSMNLPIALRIILGVLFTGSGVVMYYITVDMLIKKGKGFSAYKFTEKVVAESVYKYVRNPMSVGYYLFALGFPFMFNSLYLLIITVVGFIPVQLLYVIIYEEKELKCRFKDSYYEYSRQVPRFIPHFKH